MNILNPNHNKVGIGISISVNIDGLNRLAVAQEFINQYGHYSVLPHALKRGQPFIVAGTLDAGFSPYSIEIAWEAAPKSMTKAELVTSPLVYSEADRFVTGFYPDLEPKVVRVVQHAGNKSFSVTITPEADWKAGLYYVSILARSSKGNTPFLVSLRTTHLN
jgi:hypothetical protein